MSENLKISVITVCKNSENTISKCINSVLEQDYNNIEYIMIEGDSTDESMKVIRDYVPRIDVVVSEPDEGIYDAMNKGIKNSSGDYIIFLNADDYFISNSTVANIIKFIEAEPGENIDVFYGKVFILDNDSNKGHIWKASRVSKYSLYRGSIPHPATVYSKKAFDKCGSFDISYKIAGDYEWVVRAYLKHQLIFKPFDMVISLFLKGGVSTDKVYKSLSMREKEKVRNIYFSASERQYYKFRWFFRKNFKIW